MPGLAPWPILISTAAPRLRYSASTPKRPEAHLHDDVVLVGEEVVVQAALAGVHEDAAARCAAIASERCTLSDTEP